VSAPRVLVTRSEPGAFGLSKERSLMYWARMLRLGAGALVSVPFIGV
jgi:hypothetical protein